MLYAAQIRAARALLGWRQEDLAKAAKVGLATLARIEQGQGMVQGNFSTVIKIQRALEKEGVQVQQRIPLEITPNSSTRDYLRIKKEKLGHFLSKV